MSRNSKAVSMVTYPLPIASVLGLVAAAHLGCFAQVKSTANADAGTNTDSAARDGGAGALDAPRGDLARGDLSGPTDGARGTEPFDAVSLDTAACATHSARAEKLPLDLYVMMDSSGSMVDPTAQGPSKWEAVKAALISFLNDGQSAGLAVGIQYFPQARPNVPAECFSDGACNGFGPCFRVRTCTGTGTIMACDVDGDCPIGRSCVLVGECSISQDTCAPAGVACAGGPAADFCQPWGGYCLGRDSCELPPYSTPAVAIGALPGAAAALVGSINGRELDGLTPTSPALSGAIAYAQQHARANPGRKVAVLLVTDGFPSECTPTDIPAIADIAAAGLRGATSVPTFVIGVFGPDEAAEATSNLTALAAGGGTGTAVVINTNQNVTAMLQGALNQIRTTAVACEFRVPPATMGAIDFGKVNVQFTGANGAVTTVGYVRDRAGCDPVRGGWFYDVDPATGATPRSIITCDVSCSRFRADAAARVDIVLGCQTIVIL